MPFLPTSINLGQYQSFTSYRALVRIKWIDLKTKALCKYEIFPNRLKTDWFFGSSFRLTAKLHRKYKEFPLYADSLSSSSTANVLNQLVTIDMSILMYY